MRKTSRTIAPLWPWCRSAPSRASRRARARRLFNRAEVRQNNALEAQNARLKGDLLQLVSATRQLTADQAQLERTLALKSGELGKSIVDLRQRIGALEGDNAWLTRELAELDEGARGEGARDQLDLDQQLVKKMKGEIDKGQVTISELKGKLDRPTWST